MGDRDGTVARHLLQSGLQRALNKLIATVSSSAILRLVCGLILLMQFALTPTIAADIQRHVISEGVVAISISGEIVECDAERLIANVKAAEAKGYTISEIRLNSIGGNLSEGTTVARIIRLAAIRTVVLSGDTCTSVCFLLFAAGLTRYVQLGARIGVHAASNEFGEESQTAQTGT